MENVINLVMGEVEDSDNDNNLENESQTGDTSKFILTFVCLIHRFRK